MNWEEKFEKARHRETEPPAGYFGNLEDKVIRNWQEKGPEKPGSLRRLSPWIWAAAAAVVLLVFFAFPDTAGDPDIFQEMTSEQTAYYYLQTSDIQMAELWLDMDDIPADTLEAWLISDASLEAWTIEEVY